MGREVDLLAKYPKTKREVNKRAEGKSESVRKIARQFGFEYFDGDRQYGYGGFSYHPRFWSEVVKDLIEFYNLTAASRILDVGCAKGFLLYDLSLALPGVKLCGLDISEYALANSKEEIREKLILGSAQELPFASNSFDLVISINTVHNLNLQDCIQSLKEIERVSSKHSFITVDAYRTQEERERMEDWNLTALTMMSDSEWKTLFKEIGYTGDYFWFIP